MMRKLVTCVLASAFLGACATTGSPGDAARAEVARDAPKEDFVTGSRLRRAESPETPTSKEGKQ